LITGVECRLARSRTLDAIVRTVLAAQVLDHHLQDTHIVVYREDYWLAHASLVYCLGNGSSRPHNFRCTQIQWRQQLEAAPLPLSWGFISCPSR
jgi:hypothetical protein